MHIDECYLLLGYFYFTSESEDLQPNSHLWSTATNFSQQNPVRRQGISMGRSS